MIKIYDMRPDHMRRIQPQDAQVDSQAVDEHYAHLCLKMGECIAAIEYETSDVMMCAGVVQIWPNRYMVWSVLSKLASAHLRQLTRIARHMLPIYTGRMEAYIDVGFEPGYRWVRMLGFEFEVESKKFLPDGRDAAIFVRFN